MRASAAPPMASVAGVRLARGDAVEELLEARRPGVDASTEMPNSLGSWLAAMMSAMPAMNPARVGKDSRSVRKPRRARPPATTTTPTRMASSAAAGHRLGGRHRGERGERDQDQWRQRRIRPQHQQARRADERVDQQRHDRGVEADDRRQPGRLRVGHAGRHEDAGQRQAGGEVPAQPARAGRCGPCARPAASARAGHRLGPRPAQAHRDAFHHPSDRAPARPLGRRGVHVTLTDAAAGSPATRESGSGRQGAGDAGGASGTSG